MRNDKDKPGKLSKVTRLDTSRKTKGEAKSEIIHIDIPGLRPDGTWDKGLIAGRVNCTFTIELDGDLAEKINKETARMAFFRQWANERKIQCLAPILWKQLQRDMDRWQQGKKDKLKDKD